MANVRAMLMAAMPLPQLLPKETTWYLNFMILSGLFPQKLQVLRGL